MARKLSFTWICLVASVLGAGTASAMSLDSRMIKPRAFYQEADNNLLEALDLKSKTIAFDRKDFDQCGLRMVRRAQSLQYSCTLIIPSAARISKLQNVVTGQSSEIAFGATKRKVNVTVAPDAKSVTFTTNFDSTGIDFEVSKFNDDFYKVYDKVAQQVIAQAQARQPILLEVLESR